VSDDAPALCQSCRCRTDDAAERSQLLESTRCTGRSLILLWWLWWLWWLLLCGHPNECSLGGTGTREQKAASKQLTSDCCLSQLVDLTSSEC